MKNLKTEASKVFIFVYYIVEYIVWYIYSLLQ
jgi:hypothetical protein